MLLTEGERGNRSEDTESLLFDVSAHRGVIEVLDRGRDKVPDLLIHQAVFCLTIHNVFTGGASTEASWEVCLTRTCGEKTRVTACSGRT